MSITPNQLPDGKVVYDVYVQSWSVHGKRVQKRRRGLSSLRAARDTEAQLRAEIALERGRPERVTWEMWLKRCCDDFKVTLRPSTLQSYEGQLGKWVTPHLKGVYLDELTSLQVHQLIFEQVKGVTPHTQRSILKMLKRVLTRAVENGILTRNPALAVKVKVPQAKQTVLNATEAQKLLREAKSLNHRYYPIWATALFTGMRSGELYALRWSDIDFENHRISVTRSWCNTAGYGPTKSQKNRVVPISGELKKLLRELILKRGSQATGEDFVLPHLGEWTQGTQAQVLRDFCRSVGITPVKFHDLRATFITQLLLRGVPLAQVMSM